MDRNTSRRCYKVETRNKFFGEGKKWKTWEKIKE